MMSTITHPERALARAPLPVLLGLTLALTWLAVPAPGADVPATPPLPSPTVPVPPADPVTTLDRGGAFAPSSPEVLAPSFLPDPNAPGNPPSIPAGTAPGLSTFGVIYESIFGDIYSPEAKARWTPLYLSTYFTEGWNTPFVLPTSSSAGAPRQGWVGAFDGQFFRAWFFAFAFAQGVDSRVGDSYVGRYTIFVPFNRRLEFQWDWLFVVANKGGKNNTYHGNIGDNTFWLKTQLSETKNFGQGFALGVNAPTGRVDNGQGQTFLHTSYRFLWFPGGGNWMIRGETGPIIPLAGTGYTQYQNVLAAGRFFEGSKDSLFQHVWLYLVANQTSTVAGTPRHETLCTVMPGMRTKIPGLKAGTGLWYFFADVNVPVTGPHAFTYQPIFAILYDY